jgi:hypothetical protein
MTTVLALGMLAISAEARTASEFLSRTF